jgi:hypothetical protein
MFYPLYPIGIGAEWWLLYRAIGPGGKISWVIPPIFWGCLMLYVPGTRLPATVSAQKILIEVDRFVEDVYVHDQAEEKDPGRRPKAGLNDLQNRGNIGYGFCEGAGWRRTELL